MQTVVIMCCLGNNDRKNPANICSEVFFFCLFFDMWVAESVTVELMVIKDWGPTAFWESMIILTSLLKPSQASQCN